MDLDLQGNIEKFTLPEIFQLIAASRKSGTLGIQKDDSIVMVYFRNGDVIYGYGPRQTYHLGQLLKERGKITVEQLEDAVETQARSDNSRRLGEILVSKRYIDRADLEKVVEEQVENLLYSLLAWQTGSFKFYENQFPTEEEITVRLSIENLILEGLRRLDEMNLVNEVLPNLDAVYTISAAQGGRARAVTLEAPEWNIMALVDGHRSINQICDICPLPKEQALTYLAQLKLAGIITPAGKPASPDAAGSGNLEKQVDRLAGLFEEYLKQKPAPSANRMAGRIVTQNITGETVEPR